MQAQYMVVNRSVHGNPLILMAAVEFPASWKSNTYCVRFSLPCASQPNGLPADGEFARLSKIEQVLEKVMEGQGAVHLGHVTGNQKMVVFFYAPTPVASPIKVKTSWIRSETLQAESVHDPEWKLYWDELAPTPDERTDNRNQAVLEQLASHGDDHFKSRTVDFAAWFPTAEQREAFITEVEAQGYRLSPQARWEPSDHEFWCELNLDTPVNIGTINVLTVDLFRRAFEHGGEFDGWGCPVAK